MKVFFIVIPGSPKNIMILVVTGILGRGTTQVITFSETNSSSLKMDGWNTTFLLGRPIFRGKPLVSGRVSLIVIFPHLLQKKHVSIPLPDKIPDPKTTQKLHPFGSTWPPLLRSLAWFTCSWEFDPQCFLLFSHMLDGTGIFTYMNGLNLW